MIVHELFNLICVILMFRFSDLKHRDTNVDVCDFKHFSGLK